MPPALATTTYNANNQQTTFGANTITYDLNGNLATVTDTGVTTTYTWNARNQLAGISATGFAASFAYDSFGRRTGKTIQSATTNFVYDGLNSVQEKNGGTVTANLLTGLGIDEFFTRTDGVGTSALLPDALGSTVALGDGTGTIQTQYTYEPFGYASQTGAANTNSYKYTGREDDGTGLYYYRARYYHPRLQRFISEDPIGFGGRDANFYSYVKNSPMLFVDPLGLVWETRGTDYPGVSNWMKWIFNRVVENIGRGDDPSFPGADPNEYIGLKRDLIQVWVPSSQDPCPNQFPAGTTRFIEQTYSQFINQGPATNLLNDPSAQYYYQWAPWVDNRTYASFPDVRYQYPPAWRQR